MLTPTHEMFLDNKVDNGFTVRQLHEVFSMVASANNWKDAVDAVIDSHFRAIVERAVPFMTGSVCKFEALGGGKLRVRATGYYAEIGA